MFRSVCPTCAETSRFDDPQEGREVECPRCRTPFVARPERVRAPESEHDRPHRSDGSGYATLSLVLGVIAICGIPCCGVGAVFGLGGLLTGYSGLQSRLRTLSILGLILNLAAVILSIGAVAVYLAAFSSVEREVPPGPDGTQAPFVGAKK
jgi:DNA-directed RNA polymerase subunit RPC12/RpoP